MSKLEIKSIWDECDFHFKANFVYYFQMDPPDCNSRIFWKQYREKSMLEAMAKFQQDFQEAYEFDKIMDCTIRIAVEPLYTTTITTPGMNPYFGHHFISNSDLKSLRKVVDPKFEDPADLQEIFRFGTLFHALVLEPHKADRNHPDLELAQRMAGNFINDPIGRQLIYTPDLKREKEFYRLNKFGGVSVRCKADLYSRSLDLCGELKGLKVKNNAQFEEAMDRFDYDQALAWYLDVTEVKNYLIVAVSKTNNTIIKRYVDRDHIYYKRGIVKVEKAIRLFKETFVDNMN